MPSFHYRFKKQQKTEDSGQESVSFEFRVNEPPASTTSRPFDTLVNAANSMGFSVQFSSDIPTDEAEEWQDAEVVEARPLSPPKSDAKRE